MAQSLVMPWRRDAGGGRSSQAAMPPDTDTEGRQSPPPLGRKVNYTFFLFSVIKVFGDSFFAFKSYEEALNAYGRDKKLLDSRIERGVLEWRANLLCWASGRGKLKEATKWGLEHFLRRLGWQESPLRPTAAAYAHYWREFYEAGAWEGLEGNHDFFLSHGHPRDLAPTTTGAFPHTDGVAAAKAKCRLSPVRRGRKGARGRGDDKEEDVMVVVKLEGDGDVEGVVVAAGGESPKADLGVCKMEEGAGEEGGEDEEEPDEDVCEEDGERECGVSGVHGVSGVDLGKGVDWSLHQQQPQPPRDGMQYASQQQQHHLHVDSFSYAYMPHPPPPQQRQQQHTRPPEHTHSVDHDSDHKEWLQSRLLHHDHIHTLNHCVEQRHRAPHAPHTTLSLLQSQSHHYLQQRQQHEPVPATAQPAPLRSYPRNHPVLEQLRQQPQHQQQLQHHHHHQQQQQQQNTSPTRMYRMTRERATSTSGLLWADCSPAHAHTHVHPSHPSIRHTHTTQLHTEPQSPAFARYTPASFGDCRAQPGRGVFAVQGSMPRMVGPHVGAAGYHQHLDPQQHHPNAVPAPSSTSELSLDAATNNALDAISSSWYGVDFETFSTIRAPTSC